MNNVTINGQVIDGDLVAGKTINVYSEGDKVIINGRTVLTTQEKNITVVVNGDVRGNVETKSGDVHIDKEVGGNVKTMSGDVTAGSIAGNVSSMSGNIRTR